MAHATHAPTQPQLNQAPPVLASVLFFILFTAHLIISQRSASTAEVDSTVVRSGDPNMKVSGQRWRLLCFLTFWFTQDKDVKRIAGVLEAMYRVGLCQHHPNNQCVVDRSTDLHFDIENYPRLLVWAAAIVSFNGWSRTAGYLKYIGFSRSRAMLHTTEFRSIQTCGNPRTQCKSNA